jgi:hypothetical protein
VRQWPIVLLAALGCTRTGESLVPIDVSAGAPVADLATVLVVALREGRTLVEKKVDWARAQGGVLRLGVYVDRSISGRIAMRASGLSAAGVVVATALETTVDVEPGKVAATVALALLPVRDGGGGDGGAPDAGTPDARPPDDGAVAVDGGADGATALPPPLDHPSWRAPEKLQDNPIGDGAQKVRVSLHKTTGDAVAVFAWNGRLQAMGYVAATRVWGPAVTIAEHPRFADLEVAMDSGRRVFVAWDSGANTDPAADGVWESRSDDGGKTWTGKVRLGPGPNADGLRLAVSRNGRARLAWEQSTSSIPVLTQVLSAAFDGVRWGAVATVLEPSPNASPKPSLGIDDVGAGVLAWQRTDAAQTSHYFASSFSGATLDPPREIFDPSFEKNDPLVAVGPDGKAVALWQEQKTMGGATDTLARWYAPGGGWAAAVERVGDLSFFFWRAVLDRTGAVTVVFDTHLTAGFNAAAVRHEPGKGWQTPTLLESDDTAMYDYTAGQEDEYLYPSPSADAAGNVQVVWRKRKTVNGSTNGTRILVGRTFVPATGWQPEVTIADRRPLSVGYPTALDGADDGRALVGFVYQDPLKLTMGLDTDQLTIAWFR